MTGPGNDERRPARGGVNVEQSSKTNDSGPRRRDASPRTLHAERGPRHTSWCHGAPAIRALLRQAGVPTMWDRERQAWAVPTARLDDLLVFAEHVDRRFVTIAEAAA